MKKGMALLLACICLPAWSLDWKLPVFTLKYEVAGGASEDPDDETLLPTAVRNTASLRIREEADPAVFGLTLRTSAKDFLQQSGDYAYLEAEHDGAFRVPDIGKFGYTFGMKETGYAPAGSDVISNDSLALKAGGTALLWLAKGTSLEAGLAGRFVLAEDPADALQAYAVRAGFASRLGDWLLGLRYRGEFRFPLGLAATTGDHVYNTGSVSVQWDPNR